MSDNTRTCQVKVSTPFIFDNVQYQNSADSVYEFAKQYSTVNAATGKTYKFKTDAERMQYIIGLYGRTAQGRR